MTKLSTYTSSMNTRLLKVGEVSRLLGYSDETIRNWERAGKFLKGGRSAGGQLVWDWAELEPWLIEHGYYHPPTSPPTYHQETAAGPTSQSKPSSGGRPTSRKTTSGARRRSSKDGSESHGHLPTI